MARPPPTSYGDGGCAHTDAVMDPDLWGELQSHIDLAIIWVKLSLAPFFRLRQVCKEWNRLASDRQFLERTFKSPIAGPFFVVSLEDTADRLFTYQASSWTSMPLPPLYCEMSGLLLEYPDSESGQDFDRFSVFDLHTRVFHTLPPLPATMKVPDDHMGDPMINMTVDTTLIPYSFRVFLAHEAIGTRIYDSKSEVWTQKPSTCKQIDLTECWPSCVNDNQFLYMKICGGLGRYFDLHMYDLQKDEWKIERPGVPEVIDEDVHNIGLWQERLFVFGLKSDLIVAVWEIDLPLKTRAEWTPFDSMPRELCTWIMSGIIRNLYHIRSKFCNEHVLLHNCVANGEKAVLYNLDKKTWKKVVLPFPGCHQQLLQ